MPNVNVKGRYRIYTHDGVEPLLFTTYSNQLCSIRRPNPNTFITISTYIPGSLSPFTTFDPGSSYTIVTKSNTADFSMGPYTRADRLPSSVTFRSPNFYHGLDKNSITVALSSYALSVNAPLSTAFTYIPNQDGYFINSISFNTQRFKEGLPSLLTHLTPNSSYQFINRTPYTFFAPLQSEMGDTWAIGSNNYGQFGMGHLYDFNFPNYTQTSYTGIISAERIYGNWVKIVENRGSVFALSACGSNKKLFVCGRNDYGQLGLGYVSSFESVFKNIPGNYEDICPGRHSLVVNDSFQLLSCGDNSYGQLGLGDTDQRNTFTLVPEFISNPVEIDPTSICNGFFHSLVRDQNGDLWSCGRNDSGQLGLGDTVQRNFFTVVENIGYGDIGASSSASAYVAYGRMYACGNNYFLYGIPYNDIRIGVSSGSSNTIFTSFTREANAFTDITNLWVGGGGIFVRRSSSNVLWACGLNVYGSLGIPVSNTSVNSNYIDLDIRVLTPTIIPSNIYKFLPSVFFNITQANRVRPFWIENITYELKTIIESTGRNGTSTAFTPIAIGTGLYVNNINSRSNATIFHNRGPLPSPTPTVTPTKTPTPTPTQSPKPLPAYNTGEVLYMNLNSPSVASSDSSAYWFTDILFSTYANCPALDSSGNVISKQWAYNLYRNITAPPDAVKYSHYSYRNYVSTQIEPQNFGARKCSIFNDASYNSEIASNLPNLCFHYFSQNANLRTTNGTIQCAYPYGTVTKMAPNSGTFGDSRASTQRIVIDTQVGVACQPHFYIHPADNSYHVVYTKRTVTSGILTEYGTYYTSSTDRGSTWSTPIRLSNGTVYTSSTTMNSWFPNNNAGKFIIQNCTPFITTRKISQARPAVLYSDSTGGAYDLVNLVCKYSINSNFDASATLASGYNFYSSFQQPNVEENSAKAQYDPDFSHHKLLYDNSNNLIALWTGTVGRRFESFNYSGPGPCRIQYRYLNNGTWSNIITAGNTFPRIFSPSQAITNNFYLAGRQWDACIDDTDNTLCITYTPDAVLSNGTGWNAWVVKVKKINILTGAVIFDEIALDVSSLANISTTNPKGVGAINIYFDTNRNKLILIASTRGVYSSTIFVGSTLLYERTSNNTWSKLNPILYPIISSVNWTQDFTRQLNVR
jgi:hypothetical protein